MLTESAARDEELSIESEFATTIKYIDLYLQQKTGGKWALCQTPSSQSARLALFLGVTHCNERRPVPGRWDYTHYTVHNGSSRKDVAAGVEKLAEMTKLDDNIFFSTEELKRVPAVRARENGGALQ